MTGLVFPTKKSRSQEKRERRSGHGVCGCRECILLGPVDTNFNYIQRQPALAAVNAKLVAMPQSKAFRSLIDDAKSVVDKEPGPAFQAISALAAGIPSHHIPGYVVLCSREKEGARKGRMRGDSVLPLSIRGQDFSDGGVETLRLVLNEANAHRDAGDDPFTMAIWITGVYDDATPVHIIAANDEGEAGSILLGSSNVSSGPIEFMVTAMPLLVAQHERADSTPAEPDLSFDRLRPDAYHYFVAMCRASESLSAHRKEFKRLTEAVKRTEDQAKDQLSAARVEFRKEADARRKEAIASLNEQLEASRARADTATKEASALRARVKALEDQLADAQAPTAGQPAGAADAPPPPPSEAAHIHPASPQVDDEARSHWRDSAEHQAEVIRQLRVSLVHATSNRITEQRRRETDAAPLVRQLADIDDWAAENADRVILLRRAAHATKKSNYADPRFVYASLDLLATTYRDVKRGTADRMAFKDRCQHLGLDLGGSISEGPSEDYFFLWNGKRRFLDQHIGRGIARDSRYCFRAYFTWDEDEGKVIIGWLPSHLPTRTT